MRPSFRLVVLSSLLVVIMSAAPLLRAQVTPPLYSPNDPVVDPGAAIIHAPEAWAFIKDIEANHPETILMPEAVVVVIDFRLDCSVSPEFQGQCLTQYDRNFAPDTYGPGVFHVSAVAGKIAGKTDNNFGTSSVTLGRVKIISLNVFDSAKLVTPDRLRAALDYVVKDLVQTQHLPVVAINVSLGGGDDNPTATRQLLQALKKPDPTNPLSGIYLFASAGDDGLSLDQFPGVFPAQYATDLGSNVIGVTATRADGAAVYAQSNYGSFTLAAPGDNQPSVDPTNATNPQGVGVASNTSIATPYVTAAYALMRIYAERDPDKAAARLFLGADRNIPGLQGKVFGRLNIYRSLTGSFPTFDFATPSFSANEGDGRATITVTRSGDTSVPAAVQYATIDDPADVRCDDTVHNNGAAYARCDYSTAVDTLQFAAGETSKTFTVALIDDAHVEGTEIFRVRLTGTTGGLLGSRTDATVSVVDNDAATGSNPVTASPFFVRQQYLDFLSREPEQSGFDAWLGVLNRCPDPNNVDPNSPSAGCDRITVSSSFFGSQEFQLKGFYVFRFYKVTYQRLPTYTEAVTAMRSVTGATSDEVFAKRKTFAESWVHTTEFGNKFDLLNPTQFVDTLLMPYHVTVIHTPDPANPDGGTKVTLTRADLIAALRGTNNGGIPTLTRAQVVRAVAESDEVSAAEFNSAFVFMQYVGYLRRTPETNGYNAWLNYLNAHPTDSRTMVNGFVNSVEYRLRFGQP